MSYCCNRCDDDSLDDLEDTTSDRIIIVGKGVTREQQQKTIIDWYEFRRNVLIEYIYPPNDEELFIQQWEWMYWMYRDRVRMDEEDNEILCINHSRFRMHPLFRKLRYKLRDEPSD